MNHETFSHVHFEVYSIYQRANQHTSLDSYINYINIMMGTIMENVHMHRNRGAGGAIALPLLEGTFELASCSY